MNPIAYAVPFFFALIGVELWIARRRKKAGYYRLPDTLTALGCGVVQQTTGVFTRLLVLGGYALAYETFHLLDIAMSSVTAWVVLFFAVDLAYYAFHRASHQVNFLWAAHVVHHQSEDYNLAVALRQSAIQPLFSFWFYLPLAFVGFPPAMFLITVAINTLYQFWIHTELVDRIGPLEKVLNTPSHHRVHHGRNPRYIDKNHAGVFIVWDKLFGTFEPESEPLVYGITRPVRSWSALWSNVHPWRDLLDMARRAPTWRGRLALLVRKPGWHPPGMADVEPGYYAALEDPKFDPWAPDSYRYYALSQFVLATAAAVTLLARERPLPTVDALDVAVAAFVLGTMLVVGGLLEHRRWVVLGETSRLTIAFGMLLEAVRRGMVGAPIGALMIALVVASGAGFLYALRARPEAAGIPAQQGMLP